ncbi:MAG: cbb3-type cytochrome c oxidase subunit I [Myxococcota bacterium]
MAAAEELVAPAPPDYLRSETTARSWLLTTDHKRIGLLFLGATMTALLVGGVIALTMRIQLATPEARPFDALTYNRLFTLHGVIMVWLFLIPSIPAGFGNFLLPIMVGAREIAFPRLNLASFWLYVAGALTVFAGLLYGGADTGWTFYPPYSSTTPTAVVPILCGVFILGISSTITGLNFIVTTHSLRARTLQWMRLPLFVWSIYATSVILVLATPVLGMTLLLIIVDHAFGLGVFDPALGGDPILYQHLFWFYSHPAVYIMILPAMGVVSEVVSALSRKNGLSYRAIALSSLGIAFAGFLTWGHHMFTAGMSSVDAAIFGILSMLVAIFSAIKVFVWVGTLYRGSISLEAPMLYLFTFLFVFSFGGMTGVALASTSLDLHWHDTYFVVAHFHLIMVGGSLTAFLAALHYWFPKMFGRTYSARAALWGWALVSFGFVFTFFPQLLLGNGGMPRRYASYPERFQTLNLVSTGSALVLATGLVWTAVYLVRALRSGRVAENPWGSRGFEWRTTSPPPVHNWEEPLVVDDAPHQYWREEEA